MLPLITVDVAVVFLQRAGKDMPAVATGDKIKFVARCRMQGCQQRRSTRQRNRRRWQAWPGVGVVRRIGAEVDLVDTAVIGSAHPVDHAGVGLKQHVILQASYEYAGD